MQIRIPMPSPHLEQVGSRCKFCIMILITGGVGSTIGAGVYILVGAVAREHTGPALAIAFLVAGIAAALSAFCYAELACRCPSAGSAYHYTYVFLGESVAWLVGWALILEYTIGGSAVARGISPNLALFFGGGDKLPAFLGRQTIPGLGIVVDPCAAILVIIVTVLLCTGIKESSLAQAIVTTVNILAMLFIITAGGYLAMKTGWTGYNLPSGYFPFGVNGMLAGSAVVFFSYIGFDAVTSTAEEVKNPQRDLPLGIGMALFICCVLYMLVSIVIVGLVPYNALNPDTPISSAFEDNGMQWAAYILTTGAVTALCSSLMGSLLPQPRVLMAMARDGLLPSFFSDINEHTQIPMKSTVVTGILATLLAFFMDVSQLAGMVSIGTLLAFTAAAVSVLILRYVPPNEVPLPSSLEWCIDSESLGFISDMKKIESANLQEAIEASGGNQHLLANQEASIEYPLIEKQIAQENHEKRRKVAIWSICLVCIGAFVLASAASAEDIPSFFQFTLCAIGGVILFCSLIILSCLGEDDARHSFGHAGGFLCPFVPFLPAACILINIHLLIDLGVGTWIRVSIWLVMGAVIYIFYSRTHSVLRNAVYVPKSYADEIYRFLSNKVV
ncbi:cationic amino acid transporter 4, vacuolar isoform X2 [Carica papaya]|uniref:cationic amino acid transporter 4, vacuolar isoform X2 n=1 Tax=Carica papaya TaxID=3649 RepID=UPI000B8CDC58|nr:cationic amino acid transporter 4, vacuolar isoform X2 [Carica papaya]